MNFYRVLDFLSNVKRSGEGYSARCPGHDDKHNSLEIRIGMKRAFLNCYAFCSEPQILDIIGLKVSDLFFDSSLDNNGYQVPIGTESDKTVSEQPKIIASREICAYDYRDEKSKLLYQKVRYEVTYEDGSTGKDFRHRRFDENGKAIFDLEGVRRVPYLLPEILDAREKNPKTGIILTEGEKDARNLWKQDIPATSFKDWREEFNCFIAGANAVLLIDHDESGIRQSTDAATKIYKASKSVRLVDLFKDEPLPQKHGKDVSNWLYAGNTRDNLIKIIQNTPLWKPTGENLSLNGKNAQITPENWSDPIPLPDQLLPVPEFDTCLLPESLRPFVTDVSDRMQSPIEFVAASVIIGAASIIGNRIQIQPKREDTGWVVTPNLWGVCIGPPGVLKTPALKAGIEPLQKREKLALEQHIEEQLNYEFDDILNEINRDVIKSEIKKAGKNGQGSETLRAEYKRLKQLKEPTKPSYIVNDATIEKLGILLNQNSRGLLLFRDELVGFLRSLDKEENANARAFILECWNGYGSYVFDRVGRGETRIDNLTLSVLGGMQPGVLANYLRGSIASGQYDDGLMQRFQIAFYPVIKEWSLVDRKPNAEALSRVHECFARLDNLQTGENGEPLILRFNDQAQEFFYQWWTDLERCLEGGELEHPALIAHFAKYRSLMPSLALIFHLLDVVSMESRLDLQNWVSIDAVMKAAAWCELLGEHTKRIYGIAIQPETQLAKSILTKIKQGKLKSPFTARDIYQKRWTGLHSSEDCRKPLQLLIDHDFVRESFLNTDPVAGGRPTKIYRAHTSLFAKETE
ncbi:MAG TPA: DUF3987 domain-containing protein [Pyrinomonadaceae bacterium]|jgi:putative DNA primase/helicase